MVAITNIALFFTSVSAAVLRRDGATILSDLHTVDADVNQLVSDANSWSGSIFGALPIEDDANQLESDLKTATSDAQAAGSLSESDAQSIVGYINSPLLGDIAAAMTALKNKKSDIDNDGLDSTVAGALKDIKTDVDNFGAALNTDLPSDQQAALASALSQIDSELSAAIAEFS